MAELGCLGFEDFENGAAWPLLLHQKL